jgi:solute carrier family 13 (sodium-dependent dicarboxylate transporter), member 2/3/5
MLDQPPDDAASDSLANIPPTALGIGIQLLARVLGPLAAVATYYALHWEGRVEHGGRVAAALAVLMAIWWMTEALPLAITALLPLVVLPLFGAYAGANTSLKEAVKKSAEGYADPSIYLFLGGFILALAVERWGLHRRIALFTLRCVGTKPAWVLLGFLISTAFISMWISNTATTAMMLPIALSIAQLAHDKATSAQNHIDQDNFTASLVLGVAYAASIGGCGTLIGTPTNTLFRAFLEQQKIPLGFGEWMLFAVPLVVVYLLLCWWLFSRWFFPVTTPEIAGGAKLIELEWKLLGKISRGEWITLLIFVGTALAWLMREPVQAALGKNYPWLMNIDDMVISMAAAIFIFLVPVNIRRGEFALDWSCAKKLPWEVLLVFGGGISLSNALTNTGMNVYIGERLGGLSCFPMPVMISLLSLAVIFCSELTSNVAMIAAFSPIVLSIAQGLKIDPLLLLVPTALSCSYAFMLPAGTPPNAMAYATGRVSLQQMMRVGFCLNLAGGLLIPLATYTLGRWLLGIR